MAVVRDIRRNNKNNVERATFQRARLAYVGRQTACPPTLSVATSGYGRLEYRGGSSDSGAGGGGGSGLGAS